MPNRTIRNQSRRFTSKKRSRRSGDFTLSTAPPRRGTIAFWAGDFSARTAKLRDRDDFVAAAWIGLNSVAPAWGFLPLDPPPFEGLAAFASLASLYLVVVIVSTQRRDDRLAQKRELLTIELAILTEQKVAKAISLLEELRRDTRTCMTASIHRPT